MAPVIENNYVGDGSTVLYSFSFPYIDETDVEVSLDEVVTTEYTLANATTVQFNTAPASDVKIRIYRNTEVDTVKAAFFPGSAIRSQDLNDNFEQILFVTQESDAISERAEVAAKDAQIATAAALEAADTAESAASSAIINATAAQEQATAAASSAASAQADAAAALTESSDAKQVALNAEIAASAAQTDAANAAAGVTTAETAAANAQSAADAAQASAVAAQNSASTATSTADGAVTTASQAFSEAQSATATANAATASANQAISDAATATAISEQAKVDADAAINAVSNSLDYAIIDNVAAIPSSPSDGDAEQVVDSTGIESFTPLTGLPAGFVGDPGIYVRIVYRSNVSSWTFITFSPNDPDTRYLRKDTDGSIDGYLGLGTSSPSAPLTFGKSVYSDQTSEDFFRIKFTDFGGTTNDVGIGQPDANSLAFNIQGGATSTFRWISGTGGERMRLDGEGRLLLGTSAAPDADYTSTIAQNGPKGGSVYLSRNLNADQITLPGYYLGTIAVGTKDLQAASINCISDGTGTSSSLPGRLEFATTAEGASSPTTRLRIDSSGDLVANGAASFAGTVSVANFNTPSSSTDGINLYDSGAVYVRRSDSGAVFRGYDGTVVTAEINADGSAEFAEGKVTISSTGAYTGTNQIRVNRTGSGSYCTQL